MTSESEAGGGTHRPSAPRITIVEDDRDTREMLRLFLEDEGYHVTVVPNGLRLISSLHVDTPDLVLLDVIMSWIDGFELCRAIKKNPAFREIPVVFVSARTDSADLEEGFSCGCAAYIKKPIDMDRLLAVVRETIGSPEEEEA